MISLLRNMLSQTVSHSAGLEKKSIANLSSALKEAGGVGGDAEKIFRGEMESPLFEPLQEAASKGLYYDESTMAAMLKNVDDGVDPMIGINPRTMSGIGFLNAVAGQSSKGAEVASMIGMGFLAGGANVAAGGNFSEGAVVGVAGAKMTSTVARNISKPVQGLSDDLLKKTLGDEFEAGFRSKNIETFRGLDLKDTGITEAQRKMMLQTDPSKKTNVAMQNRLMTLGGGLLSGVAFTSNKRDYRRGFNKRRGNRI